MRRKLRDVITSKLNSPPSKVGNGIKSYFFSSFLLAKFCKSFCLNIRDIIPILTLMKKEVPALVEKLEIFIIPF